MARRASRWPAGHHPGRSGGLTVLFFLPAAVINRRTPHSPSVFFRIRSSIAPVHGAAAGVARHSRAACASSAAVRPASIPANDCDCDDARSTRRSSWAPRCRHHRGRPGDSRFSADVRASAADALGSQDRGSFRAPELGPVAVGVITTGIVAQRHRAGIAISRVFAALFAALGRQLLSFPCVRRTVLSR